MFEPESSVEDNYKFKCCINKSLKIYICIQCHGIYHKSCALRQKNKINFVSDNKVICCKKDDTSIIMNETEFEEIKSVVQDLHNQNDLKENFILKLKREKNDIVNEAIKMEEDLNAIVANQEIKLKELKKLVDELTKELMIHKNKKLVNATIQMDKSNVLLKDATTNTAELMQNLKNASTNTELIKNYVHPTHVKNINRYQPSNMRKEQHIRKKSRILILGDQHGKNMMEHLDPLKNSYDIQAILKPDAKMTHIIENIKTSTETFSDLDYVIILAGFNDIAIHRKYFSFKLLTDNIKLCSQTNVIISSIPYSRNDYINKRIYKVNQKLKDICERLDQFTLGHIAYLEVNQKNFIFNKKFVSENIVLLVNMLKNRKKNLVFVNMKNEGYNGNSLSIDLNSNESTDENAPFLYPRLSQIIIED